jgi:hypothetical protein
MSSPKSKLGLLNCSKLSPAAPVDFCSKLANNDEEVFDRIFEDRLGVFQFLKPGEAPASALAAAGAAAADEAGAGTDDAAAAAAGLGGGAEKGGGWDTSRPAPKAAIKGGGKGEAVSSVVWWMA